MHVDQLVLGAILQTVLDGIGRAGSLARLADNRSSIRTGRSRARPPALVDCVGGDRGKGNNRDKSSCTSSDELTAGSLFTLKYRK
jgi:hypothetical protein